MLQLVKLALRISTTAYDTELNMLIASCIQEMTHMNVIVDVDTSGNPTDAQVKAAIVAYCKWQFGNHEDKEQWEGIYHTKLAQLKTMTGYTDWRLGDDE